MKVYNSSNNTVIAERAEVAKSFFSRTVGLILKKTLKEGEGLVIKPCFSIHTFFMKFAIDVLFVNKKNEIVALYENVKPWRILPVHFNSYYVVELPSGTISSTNISKGDSIKFD
ncbi:MAG TPA: DUF192 domain-containing protein [Candidatus Gastranaerophilaceae bacterium]|nr:DUF192 domain-containing protein [Candidatus Gastranaerophilaceae bacterium]HPT41980.1 DUF192 domain-containing protein [Candidatus Gastranaerophilaceae bacterium]